MLWTKESPWQYEDWLVLRWEEKEADKELLTKRFYFPTKLEARQSVEIESPQNGARGQKGGRDWK